MSSQATSNAIRPSNGTVKNVTDVANDQYGNLYPTDQALNVDALFTVVSHIMEASVKVSDPTVKLNVKEDKSILPSFKPPMELLERISCQMRSKVPDEDCRRARKTAETVIEDLADYSWDARVVIALAAFALDYGNFWHLYQVTDGGNDHLGKSLAVLNHVRPLEGSGQEFVSRYNGLVWDVFLTVQSLVKLMGMLNQYHYREEVIPTLEKARDEFHDLVLKAVVGIVICASTIGILRGDYRISKGSLSNISREISDVLATLQRYLEQIMKEKGEIDEYFERFRGAFQTPSGIVQVLKFLLFPKDTTKPHVSHGSMEKMESFDETFKEKCVLLFISGPFGIEEEIKLLRGISQNLKSDGEYCEKSGTIRKKDFKIMWVPIVSSDSKKEKTEFENVKKQLVEWSYVVHYSLIPPACKKLIRQKLRYQNNMPIVPVFNKQGKMTNNDALAMLLAWGHKVFPWSTGADLIYAQNWKWFWSFNQELKNSCRNKKDYNIIYGRIDDAASYDGSWWKKISSELEKIKKQENIIGPGAGDDVVTLNNHHLWEGDKELNIAQEFWAFVENTFTSLKRSTTDKGPSLDDLKKLLSLRREKSGWVIISGGSNVTGVYLGERVYKILEDLDKWKNNIRVAGFDAAFESQFPQDRTNCLRLDLKANVSDVSIPLECVRCQSEMEIQVVRYVCCHGHHSHGRSDRAG